MRPHSVGRFEENPPLRGGKTKRRKKTTQTEGSRSLQRCRNALCCGFFPQLSKENTFGFQNFPIVSCGLSAGQTQLWTAAVTAGGFMDLQLLCVSGTKRFFLLRSSSNPVCCQIFIETKHMTSWPAAGVQLAFDLHSISQTSALPVPSDTTSKKKIKSRSVRQPPSRAGVKTSRRFLWRSRYTTAIRSLVQLSSLHKKAGII